MAIGCSAHEPGSVSDSRIFQDMRHFHKEQLKTCACEFELEDNGPMEGEFPDTGGLLLDKGYQSSKEFCRAIHSTKKPRSGVLSPAQVAENRHISSDRVLVQIILGGCRAFGTLRDQNGNGQRKHMILYSCCAWG